MRGEPNAISVATKWESSKRPSAFFSDPMVCRTQVGRDLIQVQLERRKTVVVPLDGVIKPTTCPGLCGNRLR